MFLVGVSAAESCHLSVEHLVRRPDGRTLEFVAVSDADPEEVLTLPDREEDPIDPAWVERVDRESRLDASNVAGQVAICSALHEARNGVLAGD